MHALAAMQLTGTAGDMQIANASLGGIFNMGGTAVANYVSILERIKEGLRRHADFGACRDHVGRDRDQRRCLAVRGRTIHSPANDGNEADQRSGSVIGSPRIGMAAPGNPATIGLTGMALATRVGLAYCNA